MRTSLGCAGVGRGQGSRDALGAITSPAALPSTSSHCGGLQGGVSLARFGGLVTLGAEWRGFGVAASAIPQALRMFGNLLALQPQPMLFSTPGTQLHFGNPLMTSLCSCCSTCGCVRTACSQASLSALLHTAPSASAGGKADREGGCGKGS